MWLLSLTLAPGFSSPCAGPCGNRAYMKRNGSSFGPSGGIQDRSGRGTAVIMSPLVMADELQNNEATKSLVSNDPIVGAMRSAMIHNYGCSINLTYAHTFTSRNYTGLRNVDFTRRVATPPPPLPKVLIPWPTFARSTDCPYLGEGVQRHKGP